MGVYDSLFKVAATSPLETQCIYSTGPSKVVREAITCFDSINVAIDQSTKQTGVAVAEAENNQLICIADLCNDGFPSRQDYQYALRDWMRVNFAGVKIEKFIYEIPVEHASNMYARKTLLSLMDFVERLPKYVPSLAQAEMMACNNLVWKTHYLKDPCYKGRRKQTEDVKFAAQEETWKRHPWTRPQRTYFSHPADSCDAVGILYGAFEEFTARYLGKQYRRINKLMPNGPTVKRRQHICAIEPDKLADKCWEFCRLPLDRLHLLEFNADLTIDENVNRWVRNNIEPACIVVCDNKSQQILKWEAKLEKTPTQLYCIFCMREG